MEALLRELRDARRQAPTGELEAAKQHIDEALELLDDALAKRPGPKPSARAIRSYIAEARFVLTQSDSSRAVWALSEALRALEPEEGRAVTNDS